MTRIVWNLSLETRVLKETEDTCLETRIDIKGMSGTLEWCQVIIEGGGV